MRFEWDEDKNQSNIAKHGLSFSLAREVFDSADILISHDQYVDGEDRWQARGFVGSTLLLIIFVEREGKHGEEIFRIISARRANREERRDFAGRNGPGNR